MSPEQRRTKALQVFVDVLEEGLDTDFHIVSSNRHGIKAGDFKLLTRSDFLHIKEDPQFIELFDKFVNHVKDDLVEHEKIDD